MSAGDERSQAAVEPTFETLRIARCVACHEVFWPDGATVDAFVEWCESHRCGVTT